MDPNVTQRTRDDYNVEFLNAAGFLSHRDRSRLSNLRVTHPSTTCLPMENTWRDYPLSDGTCRLGTRNGVCCEATNLQFLQEAVKIYANRTTAGSDRVMSNVQRWLRTIDPAIIESSETPTRATRRRDRLLLLKMAKRFQIEGEVFVKMKGRDNVPQILALVKDIPCRLVIENGPVVRFTDIEIFSGNDAKTKSIRIKGPYVIDLPVGPERIPRVAEFVHTMAITKTKKSAIPLPGLFSQVANYLEINLGYTRVDLTDERFYLYIPKPNHAHLFCKLEFVPDLEVVVNSIRRGG
ncbi:FirrV-1-G3 [Feldmannia irregularis virus a]|uniref:FirrV-1-G3 n=1 Tax=Feldmannia irregularis virus a TaxID=231992 RepID=Q6XLV0_9PHYC|nr:FirrV-1-G3 [Feldmannia irregularis virus a]AAR26961.1 FirrV-1-G3 [Feldmannia irregularis virus a]